MSAGDQRPIQKPRNHDDVIRVGARCRAVRGRSRIQLTSTPRRRPARGPGRGRFQRCPSHRPCSRSRQGGSRCGPARTQRPGRARAGGRPIHAASNALGCMRSAYLPDSYRAFQCSRSVSLIAAGLPVLMLCRATHIVTGRARSRTGRPVVCAVSARLPWPEGSLLGPTRVEPAFASSAGRAARLHPGVFGHTRAPPPQTGAVRQEGQPG